MSVFQAKVFQAHITVNLDEFSGLAPFLGTSGLTFVLSFSLAVSVQMSRNGLIRVCSRFVCNWFVAQGTDWNLDILETWLGTIMTVIGPMLTTEFCFASVTFNWQKIQLTTTFFRTLISNMWKLHYVVFLVLVYFSSRQLYIWAKSCQLSVSFRVSKVCEIFFSNYFEKLSEWTAHRDSWRWNDQECLNWFCFQVALSLRIKDVYKKWRHMHNSSFFQKLLENRQFWPKMAEIEGKRSKIPNNTELNESSNVMSIQSKMTFLSKFLKSIGTLSENDLQIFQPV